MAKRSLLSEHSSSYFAAHITFNFSTAINEYVFLLNILHDYNRVSIISITLLSN